MRNSILEFEQCTGCGACQNICPTKAVHLQMNSEGFLYPVIIQEKCVSCGKCDRICKSIREIQGGRIRDSYRGFSNNVEVRKTSTSGGIFSELARVVLKEEGVVFGAALNDDFTVAHKAVTAYNELSQLRGSKYVGSYVGDSYLQVVKCLRLGKRVLFSGTPCQIAALKKYIEALHNVDASNLITCDFICHGVGSQLFLEKFVRAEEKKRNSERKTLCFRSKVRGYKNTSLVLTFKDNKKVVYPSYKNSFGYPFSVGLINRSSCSHCCFAKTERVADITLADCIYDLNMKEKKYGCSLILVNSKEGDALLKKADVAIFSEPIEGILLHQPHLMRPQKENKKRKELMEYKDGDYDFIAKAYLTPPKTSIIKRMIGRIKHASRKKNKC